jgi:hypothetical protein
MLILAGASSKNTGIECAKRQTLQNALRLSECDGESCSRWPINGGVRRKEGPTKNRQSQLSV